jgi:hypothetical protein
MEHKLKSQTNMPPVQMTRAEYEAKYGTKPVVATSTLDNDPIPIRMTRSEYNAMYRPDTPEVAPLRDRLADIGKGAQTTASQAVSGEGEFAGQKPLDRGIDAVAAYSGVIPQAGYEILTSTPIIGKPIRKVVDFISEKVGQGFNATTKALSKTDLISGAAGRVETDPETGVSTYIKNDTGLLESGLGMLSGAGEIAGNILAVEGARYTLEKAPQAAKAFSDITKTANDKVAVLRNDSRVQNVVKEIDAIENKYAPTRRKADLDPNVNDSRVRIATSNVLNNAVDEDGLIRTKTKGGALDEYRKQTIDGVEDVVKRNLEIEGKKVNLNEVRANMLEAVTDSGLEGADLAAAIKRVEKDIAGLAIRADDFGDVLLDKIQDFKTSIYKHIDYTKPTGVTYRKTLARVLKETIEDKSDLPVKKWNSELAKYYKDLDRIADLDGKRVKGGRLGKYTASLAGSAVGGVAGAAAGAPGALVGGMLGGELAGFMQGKAMSRTFRRGVKGDVPENQILTAAKARADAGGKDLKTADRPVGVKSALLNDPNIPEAIKKEAVRVEGQIKKNVEQQKKAIKAGDFTLVAELKKVYETLRERLAEIFDKIKEAVKDERGFANFFDGEEPKIYRKNALTKSLMSDQKKATNAPTNTQIIDDTLPKIDAEVKSNIVRILDDYTLNKNPETYGALVKKLGEVLDKADAPKVVTTPTTLLEEAKGKSMEDFVKSVFNKVPEYGMSHRPSWEGSPSAANLLEGDMLPRDVYQKPEWSIASGRMSDPDVKESWDALMKIRNKPEAEITVWRATPKNELNIGDWVSFSKKYAESEGAAEGTKAYPFKVKAKDVLFAGDDINEFGYFPRTQLEDIWKQANQATPEASLITEAKKYKSADEFVKAQGKLVFHGTGVKFDSFDDSMRGSLTGAKSAKGAIWFTDDNATARAYSIYSAEEAVVKKALDEADALEKIAKRSGKNADWQKYDAKIAEMEDLAKYDNTFKRREQANVKEVVIDGDLYEIDAKGKSPQELSSDENIDSWLDEQLQEAKRLGKDGVKITNLDDAVGLYNRPATHYAIFDSNKIKTRTQLEDIWKQANK